MRDKSKVVITISRQLGSGGAYIGKQLAQKLDIAYMDREIINQAAKQLFVPTSEELFRVEEEIIKRAADERAAVIIGRGGSHILRDYPNHVSIFLHADIRFRGGRLREIYDFPKEEIDKMIARSDMERAHYHHKLTGKEWSDANQYDLCIDSGRTGIENTVNLILQYLESD